MTNIELFQYFFRYHTENHSASLCIILGPVNFVMWLKKNNVSYTDDIMPRVITLHRIILQAIEETDY